ncbi:MAG: hypothetical protein ACR2JV_06210 [Gaiellales bacterium]
MSEDVIARAGAEVVYLAREPTGNLTGAVPDESRAMPPGWSLARYYSATVLGRSATRTRMVRTALATLVEAIRSGDGVDVALRIARSTLDAVPADDDGGAA